MQNFTIRENHGEQSTTTKADPEPALVKASITPGYNTNINIRFVPGRDFGDLVAIPKTCKPRNGKKKRPESDLLALPDKLVAKLIESDKQIISWLARDEANTRLFLSNPASALKEAGIDLTRAEQKQLHRTHHEVSQNTVIGPGVKVSDISTAVFPDGRIGKIKPGRKPTDNGGNSCVKEA
ncbi:hypothetical protein [Thiolapillus sp.]